MENHSNYNNYKYEEDEIDLRELIGIILKRLWVIIIITVIAAVITFTYTKFAITPQYESTTKIYIQSRENSGDKITYTDLQVGSHLTNDYMALVKSRPVLEKVISDLDLDISFKGLAEQISVSSPDSTRIINITIKYDNPETSKLIADSIRDTSAEHIKDIMNIDEISIVEEGNVPQDKVSPNIQLNTLIGGMLGAMGAVFIVFAIYYIDDTIKTPDDIERYLGLSVLASIPLQEDETARKKKKKRHRSLINKRQKRTPTVRRNR